MTEGVVITGLGVASGLGVGMEALWEGLVEGRSAIGPIRGFDASGSSCRVGCEISDLAVAGHVPKSYRKAVKVMARDSQIAVVASSLAVSDAGLVTRAHEGQEPTYASGRLGCHIGAGLIAAETNELTMALVTAQAEGGGFDWRLWGEGAMNNLPPLWMLKYLPNMLACHVTIVHGAEGASNTITCAEASGLLSVGEAVQVIRRGDADASIAGGVESKLNLMGQLRLELAHRLASAGEEAGAEVVRAYDDDAGGGVLGEGGGLLIVECAAGASERGARVYAEVAGVGGGHDGPALMHQENATGESEGLVVAIEAALADAGIGPGEIDAIVPHASGAGPADRAEAWALRRVFGERLASIELVTVSANVGECMAGAGAIALGVGARCLFEQRLPARIHAGRCWEDLRAYECGSREARLGHVLVCTNSMGGQNAAIVLRATGT